MRCRCIRVGTGGCIRDPSPWPECALRELGEVPTHNLEIARMVTIDPP